MRIGLIYDCVYPFTLGGVEHRNAEIVRRLIDDHVTIYGFDYWTRQPEWKSPDCEYVSVGTARDLHRSDGKRKIGDALAAAWGTFWRLLRSKEDVWDIANIATFPVIAARLAALLKRRRLVVTWHEFFGEEWFNYLGPRKGAVAKHLELLALRCSPTVIAVSPQTRDRILAAGYPKERLRYIPNGVDCDAIDQAIPGLPSDIVYAGRLTAHKRVHLIVEAAAMLVKTNPGLTVRIIGDGPERGRMQSLIVQYQLQSNITLLGFLKDDREVYGLMKASKVALLPSAREGFGLTAVQAWACGIPVVVCDDLENATAGLVTDARLGRVVRAEASQLADAVTQLMDSGDREFRKRHARELYGLDRMVAAVRAVYAERVSR